MLQSLEVISINLWDVLISLCNLTILFFVLKKFLFKPVKNVMDKRREEIDKDYADAARSKNEAMQAKEEYEEKLASAQDEAASIMQDATDLAQKRGEKIVEEARLRAEHIVAQAQSEADLRHKKATEDIKQEIVEVSSALAEKMLEREINEEDHRGLIDSFIKKIGEDDDGRK